MTVPMTVIKIWVSDSKGVRIFFGHTIVKTKPSVDNNNCPLLKQCNILFTKNFQFFKALYFLSFCILFYFFIFILKMLGLTPPPHFPLYPVLLDLSDKSSSRKLVSLISFLLRPHCLLFVDVVNSIRFNITSIRVIHFNFFMFNSPAELFASSDGHSGNHCSALSFS